MANEKDIGSGSPPKSFIIPFILLQLFRMPIHGYELIQRLTLCGLHTLDQGNVYRILRQLEKENLVESKWDTSTAGPAKRLYQLTDNGKNYLKFHATQMERYQEMINQFFTMYSSVLNLFIPTSRNGTTDMGQKEDFIEQNATKTEEE